MKKKLLLVLLILSIKLVSVNSTCLQNKLISPSFDSLELFVSISGHDYDAYVSIKTIIKSLSGTIYLSYCTNHAVFMVYIDRNVYLTKNDFLLALQKATPTYSSRIILKDGPLINLIPFCDATDPSDNTSIKNSLGK